MPASRSRHRRAGVCGYSGDGYSHNFIAGPVKEDLRGMNVTLDDDYIAFQGACDCGWNEARSGLRAAYVCMCASYLGRRQSSPVGSRPLLPLAVAANAASRHP